MKKRIRNFLCLVLVAALLSGCSLQANLEQRVQELVQQQNVDTVVAYKDMVYTRPDMQALKETLAASCEAAKSTNLETVLDGIDRYYEVYDDFYTNLLLADIRYSGDLTDSKWQEEYQFCSENSVAVDAGLDELYSALAGSPCREKLEEEEYFGADYFDAYDGGSGWDEELTALMEQESQLQNRYYQLSEEALEYEFGTDAYFNACGNEMMELLVELIAVRQELAAYWGYDNFTSFASDFYYSRDYTIDQTTAYLDEIRQELVPLYRQMNETTDWQNQWETRSEEEIYAYVRDMAQAMGGRVAASFEIMDQAGLYDITYSENKYNSSFEVYLNSYYVPFVFMNPTGTTYDYFVFAHEFGHFCNDYISYGSYAGTDVTEVFSQGMEYLSLCYGENREEYVRLKMQDCLDLYVEQAAFARFEQEMYQLTGEDLTVEGLCKLYDRIARDYGFDSLDYDAREFVTMTHYYTNPAYIISYVVSNDASLQLYQLELEQPGQGLQRFQDNLDTSCVFLMEFLDVMDLESPFAPGRLEAVRKTLEAALLPA